MDFYEVLDQIVDLLKQRERVTYRALQAHFQLDDELLETLKDELLFSHPVVDKDGRGLEWTGEKGEVPEPASRPAQLEPQPIVEQTQPDHVQTPSIESPVLDAAERRQLTVMFCDLVGSTELSGQLDAEDYREVVRAYQTTCSEVIERFDCHIAQTLGDGLLIYSGYPVAHENDAERAVRVGLGILTAMQTLNERLEQDKGIRLAVHVGIHTGPVVVGEVGTGESQEQLALGEVPNVASRIEGLAEPDTVVISADTYRLIQGYFDCETLGEKALRGVAETVVVYQVLRESGVQSRLDIVAARGLTPLVGRESESTLLFERWEQAKSGQGQVVLLSGEAGIGKSRLVQVLKDHVAEGTHTRLECRSLPYFTNSALYSITDMVQRTLQFQPDDIPETKLEKLEHSLRQYRLPLEETVPLFGTLLSLSVPEDRHPPLTLSPQRQRQKTLESILTIILELSERQPVVFILEDLHWSDPTTLEFLDLLIAQLPTASVYALLTCRPEFQPSWSHRSYLTEVTVNRLSPSQIEQLAEQVADRKALPDEIVQQLVDKTDGVPLYVEEMTKSILESGTLKETNGHYELSSPISSLTIPATLQDSLMGRLDRLMTAKVVAQLGATIGRQFEYELLHAVAQLDEPTLQRELGRLVEAELIYQRGLPPQAMYTFKHALIQDTAYQSLLRNTRQNYHWRIAEVLEEQSPETVETQPELLAHHYTEAGRNEQAVDFWYKAGQKASERSAHVEAIAHLTKGLDVLMTLPASPERVQQELNMQIAIGPLLMATKGFAAPDVEYAYNRAHELCQQVGETSRLFPTLWGLWVFNHVRAEYQAALVLGEQLLSLAQRMQDLDFVLQGHHALETTLLYLGEYAPALEHMEKCLALYDSQKHRSHAFVYGGHDPGMCCLSFSALALWYLGYPDQALVRSREALALTEELAHPNSSAHALNRAAYLSQLRRDGEALYEQAEKVKILATEHEFGQLAANAAMLRGYALSILKPEASDVHLMRQGLTALQSTGAVQLQPYYLGLLAEVYGNVGQIERGLVAATEALQIVDTIGEGLHEAELHRLKGELLLSQSPDNATEAETCFHQAISIAQNQSAKSWELRAATSLAKLWQSQGKRDDARALLAPVYNWFTEGFDTADLKDAKVLLDELS